MVKHLIVLAVACLAVIFGTQHLHPLVMALVSAHDWVSELLLQVFAGGQIGSIIRQFIALIAVPVLIGLIPTLIYYLAKRRLFPYFMQTVWVFWLIQTVALITRFKVSA